MKKVKIKLLKDLEVGRKNDTLEVPFERANYLIRTGGAVEWKQTRTEAQPFDKANESDTSVKQPVKKGKDDGKGGTNGGAKRRKKATTPRKS